MREGQPGADDPFRPPDIPIEVHCIHCGSEYESYLLKWVPGTPGDSLDGFWCCPTPGCDGVGFCFDIWPTDPEWRDEDGNKVLFFTDDEEEDGEGAALDEHEESDDGFDGPNHEWSPEWEQAVYGDAPETSEDEQDDTPEPPGGKRPPEMPFGEDDIPF